MSKWLRKIPWLVIPVMMFSFAIAHAQQLTGTLSGIVTDQTDARVPGARVVIINEASGDVRESKSDSQGFFSVTALIPGAYKITISAKGFTGWAENGIVLNQGDSRTVANIKLKIGSEATAVTVISGADAEVPVDTAEVSATLNNELVDSATLTGRNAAELIKMMPGVTFTSINGANGSGYNSQVTGTNNGPAGDFSANGTQPYGSTAVMLDGAMLVDPGNAGTQIANINQDMTDSVKYLSASYGAEYAKGPAVLQAFSKSGGQKFHGEGYLYARNTAIGYANDWFNKSQQLSQNLPNKLTPQSFYYIGGNVGGPIFFPHFNHNKDKLFFWAGYEKMIQHPYNAAVDMNVPTDDQRNGDFNNIGVPSNIVNSIYPNAYKQPCNTTTVTNGCNLAVSPWATEGVGTVPNLKSYFDPAGAIVNGLNPKANQTPNMANGWNNFGYSPVTPQDRWEVTGKVNYSFNDNNKLWGSYTYQTETDSHPLSVWWAPPNTIPYPGDPVGIETAHVYLANYTHVFSPTTTNEFVFAYAEFVNNTSLSNPSAVSRKSLGFPTGSLFGSSHAKDVIPDFQGGWEDGINWIGDEGQNEYDSGIYGPNTFGKTAKAPNISDTFTKIVRTHAIKAGFYWDTQENLQSPGSPIDGVFVADGGSTSTYNETLDQLLGRNQQYYEQNSVPIPDYKQHQWSIWGQDSWKASRKLTLNLGLRLDHIGQWYDTLGGTQVWDPSTYDNSATAAPNTGLQWDKINSKIPASGWASKLFTYNPRVGFAFDVFGNGRTVVRSGFGTYRYQVSSNDAGGAMVGPLGSFQFGTTNAGVNGLIGYNIDNGVIQTLNSTGDAVVTQTLAVPTGTSQNHGNVTADALGDNNVPYANTWSFGVAQALPSHTVAEVSYVGSASREQLENGSNGHISDANAVPYGSFFLPDPLTGVLGNPAPIGGNSLNVNDYRPLQNYNDIWIQTHGGYANYNSLQISAQKQSGNLYLFTNFTFGKVLGTRDGNTSNGNGNGAVVNPFSLDSNYGPLQYDHTKVFNFSASYKLPNAVHNRALGEIINGWQLSNYTTYEDGAPYQAQSVNMNANYQQQIVAGVVQQTFTMPSGLQTQSIGNNTWFGTSQYENGLQPVVVCDPRKGLLKNQYFNPNCFAAPLPPTATSFGQTGQIIWPYIRTPHYFGSDLATFKAFRINDSQRIEIRISATNWLNHPNAEFGQNGNSDNQLTFVGASSGSTQIFNTNQSTTGIPSTKSGYRWMQFAAKYYF
ncbi:MAG TPA: TonB-dependent receptor [Terracidiphilus sp.]|jgi:hypothetical protein